MRDEARLAEKKMPYGEQEARSLVCISLNKHLSIFYVSVIISINIGFFMDMKRY